MDQAKTVSASKTAPTTSMLTSRAREDASILLIVGEVLCALPGEASPSPQVTVLSTFSARAGRIG